MKEKKDKAISIRVSQDLYSKYVTETIKRSGDENKLIKVSEIIREALESYMK